ncbi:MAG: radical SAM protein [Bacteroidales bacterium]|nr:radical SAM protein [Bacteroidales bacterium]
MLFKDYIYGPVISRRFGTSLGINLIFTSSKICTYNCIYCECGLNSNDYLKIFPDSKEIIEKFETKLKYLKENYYEIDVITFAGNGEPTLHPDFYSIVTQIKKIKNYYYPLTKIVLLTNGTQIFNNKIIESLEYIDMPVFKIDSAKEETAKIINQYDNSFNYNSYLEKLITLKNKIYLQTMFLRGILNNKIIDNTTTEELDALIEVYKKINPITIYLYSIDRPPAIPTLQKLNLKEMETIAKYISQNNLNVHWVL